jgi:hypothetical protein
MPLAVGVLHGSQIQLAAVVVVWLWLGLCRTKVGPGGARGRLCCRYGLIGVVQGGIVVETKVGAQSRSAGFVVYPSSEGCCAGTWIEGD